MFSENERALLSVGFWDGPGRMPSTTGIRAFSWAAGGRPRLGASPPARFSRALNVALAWQLQSVDAPALPVVICCPCPPAGAPKCCPCTSFGLGREWFWPVWLLAGRRWHEGFVPASCVDGSTPGRPGAQPASHGPASQQQCHAKSHTHATTVVAQPAMHAWLGQQLGSAASSITVAGRRRPTSSPSERTPIDLGLSVRDFGPKYGALTALGCECD